jgi:uncharacterized protein (TIGR03066 family)
MSALRLLLAAVLVVGLSLTAHGQDKKDAARKDDDKKPDLKKALVGKWEAIKVSEGTLPMGAVVEFTADGKMRVTGKEGGMERKAEGTYTIEGNSFTFNLKVGEREAKQKIIVKKISDTELDTADESGNGVTFKRIK